MAEAPIWITDAGSLGVVPEGKFYRIALEAEDPDFPGDPSAVTYSLIAGALPAGVQVNTNGTIEGIPVSVADVKGVPAEVSANIESKFAIRVIDAEDRISDRTFTLTVSGQDKPFWITPAGPLGEWFDGGEVEYQLLADDLDPGDELTMTVVSGSLPGGLTLSLDGLISGFADPLKPLGATGVPGFDVDGTSFDEFPLDFTATSISKNYQFTVRLTDGKDVVLRTFEIFIHSRDGMTADTIELTADTSNVTADSIATRSPYITNHVDDIGRYRHDNYFAYKFEGEDPDGDLIKYRVAWGPESDTVEASLTEPTADVDTLTADRSSLPLGLYLDPDSGWLHGYLPDVGLTERTYTFGIKVFKENHPDIESLLYVQDLTIYGNIDTVVEWITDSDLGFIDNGEVSTLGIEAVHADTELSYRFETGGTSNKLPQGLQLMPSGNIIGQVSFKTFTLDGNTTTVEEEFGTRLGGDPTTFDLTYTFTAEAYSEDGIVSVTKEFTITVNKEYDTPYIPVYCKALPPLADRILLDSLLSNTTVIPRYTLYRADDPNFGVAERVVYNHAYGLAPADVEDYFAALEFNHYNKDLILGEIKTARALDENEDIIYEVVYSQIIDTLVNANGENVSPSIPVKNPVYDNGVLVNEVYPNSLDVMRERLVDEIGQVSKVLPTWMLSKQEDGIVPGFTPAWVIAYVKPGQSKLLQYNIQEFFGTQLNLINFEVDRYTLDLKLLEHWGITVDSNKITADDDMLVSDPAKWKIGIMTTFDRTQTTADTTQVLADDDRYYIDGWTTVETPPLGPGEIPRDPGLYGSAWETIFDGGSVRFTSPVDVYDSSDTYDKYIKFPRTQIINNTQLQET